MKVAIFVLLLALIYTPVFAQQKYSSGNDVVLWLGVDAHQQAPAPLPATGRTGWQKAVTVILYPFTPYRRDAEDRVINVLNGAYVSVGYWDLYETMKALDASPTIRETSPIFGTYFNGRPPKLGAFAAHTGVNYLYLTGIRYAHNWAHDKNSQTQGKWKRASEYLLWGLMIGVTIDRGFTAKHNRDLAAKYGK